MAKSRRVLLVEAQYFGGMAVIMGLGTIVGAAARNVAMIVLGLVTTALALWGRRRRKSQAEEAFEDE